ncbi:TPA: DNA cytosine methyltransferase [Bacillus mobilis]|uniref:DNA cytosine methyltransferase n=1 Tax=Bacillus mobilis TaxID=2026190 RepID=UPI0021BD3545|nr:DNA cytosine methyltransferase [Bacillus mobilis]MED4384480.1 DNA cytosine methyltransferase [Bacillus mobilis]
MSNQLYNTIDLFAGCGGLLEGFKQSGSYNTIACVEWEKPQVENLTNRLKVRWGYSDSEERVLHFDMQRTQELIKGWENDDEYGTHLGLEELVSKSPRGEVDVIVGGPPCQAYSLAGRIRDENGMRDDYRNYLFESYLEVVKRFKPKFFVFENVQGMLSSKPDGKILVTDLIRKAFNKSGYDVIDNFQHALFNATAFGVPQNRKRVIILGVNKEYYGNKTKEILDMFYNEIIPKHFVNKTCTVRDAISDLPKIIPADVEYKDGGKRFSHIPSKFLVPNHIPRYSNKRDIQIFKDLAQDLEIGENKYVTTDALKALYTERTGKESKIHKYYVLRWDEPSNTIPAHLYKDGLRHIHPDSTQARSITVREAARLQTFDDDYEFIGSIGDQYKMIGNAVPPLMSRAIALSVAQLLQNNSRNKKDCVLISD